MKDSITKIAVTLQADQTLDRMCVTINDGFTGGRVTKSALISWIISYFENSILEEVKEKIRKDHFDQIAYLESVVKEMKQARKTGADTPDVSSLLAPITSGNKTFHKKRSNTENQNYIT